MPSVAGDADPKVFGDMVRGHRRRAAVTQEELAVRAGVSCRTVREIEAGRVGDPRPATVRQLADALDLTGPQRHAFISAAYDRQPDRPPADPVPAQLPADVAGFTARADALSRLDALVTGAAGSVVIAAISGTAGVGKTALAVHFAHRVAGRFPDGQLYVNLHGFDPAGSPLAPSEVIHRFLDALGVAGNRRPTDLDAQATMYRSLVATRRLLIVLDNARDSDQVRPLLPGMGTCLVLVTSRRQLTGLVAGHDAHPVGLDVLSDDEARQMLERRLGRSRTAAEPDAVGEIIAHCVHLPLALAVAAAGAATNPRLPLSTVAAQLSEHRLDALVGDDARSDVRAVLSWSYDALSPAAARLFRLLALNPGPDISAPAAASLTGLPLGRVRTLLAELVRATMVHEGAPGRYGYHDLLRSYAADLTRATDSTVERTAAIRRVFDHYLHTAYGAERLLHPSREPLVLAAPEPGTGAEQFADSAQALDWLTTERAVLLAAVGHGLANGLPRHTWQLGWTLWTFLDSKAQWYDQVAVQLAAMAAAQVVADEPVQARIRRNLARAYIELGRLDEARTELDEALDIATRLDDRLGQAHTQYDLAYLWWRRGDHVAALHCAQQALDLYRAAGHRTGQADALNDVGWYHAMLGDYRQTLTHCQQALALHRQLGSPDGEAATLDSLGYAHHHLGEHVRAIDCFSQARTLYQSLGDSYREATITAHLGDAHDAAGDPDAARSAWRTALDILVDLDHPDVDDLRTKLKRSL
jgi:tetratricopeptide (TPR) repeat protein/transcriptional regulator with XRE-family HTH domain